jgi:acetylornithine deacetylase/succinyl-diaminopimelate desuccinylase-like protein
LARYFKGTWGHGSREFEKPPIEKIATFVAGLAGLREIWADKYADPLLGKPMINATVIYGGKTENVVPSTATTTCNLRVTPRLLIDLEAIRQELEAIYDVTIEQSGQPSPVVCTPNEYIYTVVQRALPKIPFRVFPGATEQPFFHAHGIPMLMLGPGDDATMHQPNESTRISSIVLCGQMLKRIISHF